MKTSISLDNGLFTKKRTPWILFLVVYPLIVVIRYLLAVRVHYYATVLIDEHLYYSIARSIANGEGLLFMGQPANYTSILYPLLLSPIYKLFPEGSDFFRLIQLFNSIVINLSLIPIYCLAKKIIPNGRTAVIASILALLLPDMALCSMILSEAVLYPLFFSTAYFAYRYFEENRPVDLVLVGILGGLTYFTKPGQVVTAFVVLLFAIIQGVGKRDRRSVLAGAAGILCVIAVSAAGLLLARALSSQPVSLLGVYDEQFYLPDGLHLRDFFRALVLSPFCFCLVCCSFPLIIPALHVKERSAPYKAFLSVILVSIAVLMVGIAWTINRVEYKSTTIHMRYFVQFVPLLLLLSLVDADDRVPLFEKKEKNRRRYVLLWGITGYTVLCALVFGLNAGVDRTAALVGSFSLASLLGIDTAESAIVLSVVYTLFAVFITLIAPLLQKRTVCRMVLSLIAVTFLVNSVCVYRAMHRDMFPAIVDEAAAVREAIGGEDFVYVYATNKREYNAYLDPKTKKSIHMVYVNDLFNNTVKTQGVYRPFVPDAQRGTIPYYPTPDVETLAVDQDAMKHLLLSEGARVLTDASMRIQVLTVPRGERWVDAFLGGPVMGEVKRGQTCHITFFTEELKSTPRTVSLELDIEKATSFVVGFAGTSYSFDLPAGKDTYSVNLTLPTEDVSFYAADSDMKVLSFSIR